MKFLLLSALLVPLAFADPIPLATIDRFSQQLRKGDNGSRIIGGSPATDGQIPYICSLRYIGSSHFCGSTIISDRSLVTAAHCVEGDQANQLQVRCNTLTHGSGGVLVTLANMFIHEEYDSFDIDNDIALLNLATALDLSQPNTAIVALPDQGSDPADGLEVDVSGWGTTSEGAGSLPANLLTVKVPIVDRAKCNDQYQLFGGITQAMICAGVDAGGLDACQGDSGGPLVANGVLLGATSWGYGCARPNYAGVYTRVGLFVNWIRDRMIQ